MDEDEGTTTDKICFKGIHSYIYSVQNFSAVRVSVFHYYYNNISKKLHTKGTSFFNDGYMMYNCVLITQELIKKRA